jgi:hypothetical protein
MSKDITSMNQERKITELQEKETKIKEKYGYVIHLVKHDNYFDVHTHGVVQSLGHLELQFCINVDPNLLSALIKRIYNLIKDGSKFKPNHEYSDILSNNFKVKFILVESDKLRIILPDKSGVLDQDKMHPNFAPQYTLGLQTSFDDGQVIH